MTTTTTLGALLAAARDPDAAPCSVAGCDRPRRESYTRCDSHVRELVERIFGREAAQPITRRF